MNETQAKIKTIFHELNMNDVMENISDSTKWDMAGPQIQKQAYDAGGERGKEIINGWALRQAQEIVTATYMAAMKTARGVK